MQNPVGNAEDRAWKSPGESGASGASKRDCHSVPLPQRYTIRFWPLAAPPVFQLKHPFPNWVALANKGPSR